MEEDVGDSKNKTRKRPISFNPNLPFEDLNSSSDTNTTAESLKEGEGLGNEDVSKKGPQFPTRKMRKGGILLRTLKLKEINLLSYSVPHHSLFFSEGGKYREALGKWESAITLMPERAILHEQKAQVLLELGEAWNALKAATRATELEPRWAEAWVTLGRAQLNYGEPDCAIESFDKALALKPDSVEAKDDRETASHLLKWRKQLHSRGLSSTENRFLVRDQG
ncbi:UNVERIFIED_CONTAM: Tetratricopeptide repeat protein 33 [Sesamum angustifolium]|uniref:Tetratricopeptide repeat protein 33 n=1 Tax=Sesamum angustifolium TaxID=2727405 RepID=A0AAW2L6F6_9LAMI